MACYYALDRLYGIVSGRKIITMGKYTRRRRGILKGECKWFPGSDCSWCTYNQDREKGYKWDGFCTYPGRAEKKEAEQNELASDDSTLDD